jgi:hypothetical protein
MYINKKKWPLGTGPKLDGADDGYVKTDAADGGC